MKGISNFIPVLLGCLVTEVHMANIRYNEIKFVITRKNPFLRDTSRNNELFHFTELPLSLFTTKQNVSY